MRPWCPLGTRSQVQIPTSGTLLAWTHAVWRVVEVNEVPPDQWTETDHQQRRGMYAKFRPQVVVLRPAHITGDDPRARDRDLHLRTNRPHHIWDVYDSEHYPVCKLCQEPLPCREQLATRESTAAATNMARYELAGVCPACQEPVTPRQRSHTFAENLVAPLGPPVTFHLRNGCLDAAAAYDRRFVAADPDRRRPTLYCEGHLTRHGDGGAVCSDLACPGDRAIHTSQGWCRCRCVKEGADFHWLCHEPAEVAE